MQVQEHRTMTERTGGITVVTALSDIPKLYLAVDNTRKRKETKNDLTWLMRDIISTDYAI